MIKPFKKSGSLPIFFEFGRSGRVYTRDQIIHLDSQPIHAVLPLSSLAIRLLDRNTAQVTYNNSQVEYDGIVEYGRRSSVWSRTESGWVNKALHTSHN